MNHREGQVFLYPGPCLVLERRVDRLDRVWWRVLFLETGLMMSLEEAELHDYELEGNRVL